ncbi:MAG: GNAT family N-acetyltransferase [candidate division Zixibacteria bacterium]|nr:GNAT family N-acetyltransferase [candidate division Zixibacteria bacterium]
MKKTRISYRKCRKKDLVPSFRIVMSSINNLRKRTGKAIFRRRINKTPPLIDHVYSTNKDTFYCAWRKEQIIGFAAAVIRGKQWYLAWLFVHPRYQDKKVGRQLLNKVWRDSPGMTHALCTFAYNMQAVGIYSKFGLSPLCTIPVMTVRKEKLAGQIPNKLVVKDNPSKRDISWINKLEDEIRGHRRREEIDFWNKSEKSSIYLFKKRGENVGYSIVHKHGEIGPAGAISSEILKDITETSLYLAEPEKNAPLRLYCPTHNVVLYQHLIEKGFRNDEMTVYMADAPYPDAERYLPATLALF